MMPRIAQPAIDKTLQQFGQRSATAQRRNNQAPVQQPQFSGITNKLLAGSSDSLISMFQKITEIYLVGFLAIDVVALWITRIIKGLQRGAEKYDAANDPANEGLPPSKVLQKSFRKNLQGLNWLNGLEEALREVITGPAGFVVPAVTFSFASRQFAKNSIEMGYGPLTQMKDAFANYAATAGKDSATLKPAEFKNLYRDFLRNVLKADDDMLSKTIDVSGKNKGKTFAQYIDDWTERWVKTAGKSLESDLPAKEQKTVRTALEKLNAEFEETLVKGYNRKHRLGDRLYHHNNIAARLADKSGQATTVSKPIDELLTSFTRFKDFSREVVKSQNPGGKLSEVVEKTYRKLVGKKFFFGILATLAASAFMYVIPRISQRNKHYPANRLYMEGGATQGNNTAPQNNDAMAQLLQSLQATPHFNGRAQ